MKLKIALCVVLFLLTAVAFGNNKVLAAYGTSVTTAGSTTDTPRCTAQVPETPVLYEPWHQLLPKAKNAGEVILRWHIARRATHYLIAFGLSAGNYIYGAPNVGNHDSNEYTVSLLVPGKKYYFAVKAINDCMPSDFSNEWVGRAKGYWGTPSPISKETSSKIQAKAYNNTNRNIAGVAFEPVNKLVRRDAGVSL